jgi:hypothetical protein
MTRRVLWDAGNHLVNLRHFVVEKKLLIFNVKCRIAILCIIATILAVMKAAKYKHLLGGYDF